ncbi:MAG: polyprenyl synthetase family protein [Candidatus Omnitrophica bacterium]|nr:polyprenyl synthetase family protein [Candidatus Omnitrophota bacterium]
MMSSFKQYAAGRQARIDLALKKNLYRYEDPSNIVFGPMKYALFPGGKRIRPFLCVEACRMCGGRFSDAVQAACALEYIHTCSLVHDDLPAMDNDDYRRGRLSCHKKFGEAQAILAGDALLALAFRCTADIDDGPKSRALVKELFRAVGTHGIIGGQGYDIKYAGRRKADALINKINMLKTAALFEGALVAGAISAGARREERERCRLCGRLLGKAFQMRDDILDGEYPARERDARKRELRAVITGAKTTLDIFGKKADNLRDIINSLIL